MCVTYATLAGDWDQAQELVQEAYMKAWRHWERLSEYEDVEAWLRLVESRQALRRLPALQRQAMALHYLFGLPVAQIATTPAYRWARSRAACHDRVPVFFADQHRVATL